MKDKKPITEHQNQILNQNLKRTKVEEWVRKAFKDDIIPSDESGLDDDVILILPHMEAGSWVLIYEYYTGIKHINTSEKGTGNGLNVRVSKFLDMFSEIVDTDKLADDIINDLIAYSDEKNLGYSWYFRFYLDKIQYDNFVDVRKIFSDLYWSYVLPKDIKGNPTDHGIMLQAILTANKRFKEFIRTESQKENTEGESYKKAFFSL